jgi:hypothetical protein
MLQGMSPQVRECLTKAAEARRKGDEASDKEIKAFWREMEERWIRLAASYQQVGRTDDFLKNARSGPGSDGAKAGNASFLRQEGTEFLHLAQECNEPAVEKQLRIIGAELLNEANRSTQSTEKAAQKGRGEA